MKFDGSTYRAELDGPRLESLLEKVKGLMLDGEWRTLGQIQAVTGGSEGGVSARLRDLRKERFGGYRVERRHRGNPTEGLYEYRLLNSVVLKPVFDGSGQGSFL